MKHSLKCPKCGEAVTVPSPSVPAGLNVAKKIISLVLLVIAVAVGGIIARSAVKLMPPHSSSTSTAQFLVELSKRLNTSLPLQLDKGTRLDTIRKWNRKHHLGDKLKAI